MWFINNEQNQKTKKKQSENYYYFALEINVTWVFKFVCICELIFILQKTRQWCFTSNNLWSRILGWNTYCDKFSTIKITWIQILTAVNWASITGIHAKIIMRPNPYTDFSSFVRIMILEFYIIFVYLFI